MKRCQKILPLLGALSLTACLQLDMAGEDAPVFAEGGAEISLEWIILRDGSAISCVDAGATEIEITVIGAASETRQRTSCFGGFAVVDTEAAGMSYVEVSLVSPKGDRIVTAELGEVELVAGATVPLGAVELKLR